MITISEAATRLGIPRTTLNDRIKKLGIQSVKKGNKSYLTEPQLRKLSDGSVTNPSAESVTPSSKSVTPSSHPKSPKKTPRLVREYCGIIGHIPKGKLENKALYSWFREQGIEVDESVKKQIGNALIRLRKGLSD